LTEDQGRVWTKTVNAMPEDWFRPETLEMLAQYCRHVIMARDVSRQIELVKPGTENFDVREYALLLRCLKQETEAISSTATKLRITLQSTYDKSKKKPRAIEKPWDDFNEDSRERIDELLN
jgi:hypothetical protein